MQQVNGYLSILPCAPLRTSLPTSIASAISSSGMPCSRALPKWYSRQEWQFADSVIKFHMVLSPFICTDEITPKKDTALDHPLDGEEIFLARRNPFSVGLEKFLQRYSETGSNSRCRLHRIGIKGLESPFARQRQPSIPRLGLKSDGCVFPQRDC
jgi:hypothetical protein